MSEFYKVTIEWAEHDKRFSSRNKMQIIVEVPSVLHVKQAATKELERVHPGAILTRLVDTLPVDHKGAVAKHKTTHPCYYLWKIIEGKRCVLWKLHVDTVDWIDLTAYPKRKPHFYKTLKGAREAAKEHNCEYEEWHETQRIEHSPTGDDVTSQ